MIVGRATACAKNLNFKRVGSGGVADVVGVVGVVVDKVDGGAACYSMVEAGLTKVNPEARSSKPRATASLPSEHCYQVLREARCISYRRSELNVGLVCITYARQDSSHVQDPDLKPAFACCCGISPRKHKANVQTLVGSGNSRTTPLSKWDSVCFGFFF